MPIYEYKCKECKNQFEKLMKMNEPNPPCPECAASKTERIISQSSFILKGSGWYRDGYGLKGSDK